METLIENASYYLHYFASFILIISVIVFIHEYGHFWVARKCGVKIDAFSIGFGPELFGWTDKHGCRWQVAAFPLGGYVKMFGDISAASTPDKKKLEKLSKSEQKMAFHCKPLSNKAAIVAAGPAANFILAIFILTFFIMYYGKPQSSAEVGDVMKGSAAATLGLRSGDYITNLDGKEIKRFEDIREIATMNPGTPIDIIFVRDGRKIKEVITPKLSETKDIFGNKVRVGLIGITSSGVFYEKVGPSGAIIEAIKQTYSISKNTLVAIGQIITGKRSSSEISGILRIGKYSGQATEKGFSTVIWFMAVLSINLGLINLFPVPLLDGGHLMFYAIEAAKGRPLAERVQNFSFRIGFALLITLMIFATINDLRYFNLF